MKTTLSAAAAALLVLLLAAGSLHALTYAGRAENIAYFPAHNLGYDGTGVTVSIIDMTSPNVNHATFYRSDVDTSSRVVRVETYDTYGSAGGVGSHANRVAGIMAGRGQDGVNYAGLAKGADIWAATTSGLEPDVRQAYIDFITPNGQDEYSQIFVMSLAEQTADDGTSDFDCFLDWMVDKKRAFIALAPGNGGSSIWTPGGAYNAITVGSLKANYREVGDVSGRGPTADGRSKPDILAAAASLYRPGLGDNSWEQGSSVAYTSYSAPFAAGAAAMLRQFGDSQPIPWEWDPRIIKSVILNSAVKLSGWTHTDTQPLDYNQGAGRMNVLRAYYQYAAGQQDDGDVSRWGWHAGVANSNEADKEYTIADEVNAGSIISLTMIWNRHTVSGDNDLLGSNWTTTKFEDLNLYLYRDSDDTLVAQSVSTIDNVEHIYYQVEDTGTYTIVVELNNFGIHLERYVLSWFTLIPGDANGDGKVDGGDLARWQRNYDPLGLGLLTFDDGDWNSDGRIDGADLALWQRNYDPAGVFGSGPALPLGAMSLGVEAVPEPTTITLLALGVVGLVLRSRRKRDSHG